MFPEFLNFAHFVITKGYSDKNPTRDYALAKEPGYPWTKRKYNAQQAEGALEVGHWIGVVVPAGFIVCDVDNPEGKAYVEKNLHKFEIIMKTKNGYHLWFAAPEASITGATHLVKGGFEVTFRNAGKNFVIIAPTPGREWLKVGEAQELPLEFLPVAKPEKIEDSKKNASMKARKVKKIPIEHGSLKGLTARLEVMKLEKEMKPDQLLTKLSNKIKYAREKTKHDTRLHVGHNAGSYRLPEAQVDFLASVAAAYSKHPEKARKDVYDGYQFAILNYAPKVYQGESRKVSKGDQRKKLIWYCATNGLNGKMVTNGTIHKAGVSCRAIGTSIQRKIGGVNQRVHQLAKSTNFEIASAQKEQQKQQLAHTQQDESDGLQDAFVAHWVANMAKLAGIDSEVTSKPPGTLEPGDEGFDMLAYVRAKLGET